MRTLLVTALFALSAAFPAGAATPDAKLTPPPSGKVKVAFMVSDNATLIDLAGPMQTFDQVQGPGEDKFETFTVSETRKPIKAGTMTIVPDYTFADAPDADIVVVGAQSGSTEPYLNYLRHMAAEKKLMVSVCTGVSKFAAAGLLDGLEAATHHDYVDTLHQQYPKVSFVKDQAYIHSAPLIYTAGGETSGIELTLHIVELYFDHDVAVKTARYMEYRGPAWQR
jgi:transcriptional regulator GlxA family with amidase domain